MKTAAAVYARVSSARQKEDETISSQIAALQSYAATERLEVPPDWVFQDEGYSGATLIRPALERLRDLAAEVEVPLILCYSPDRLARKYVYQALLVEEFSRTGTEVRFLKGPKTHTAEDELLLQFQGMIAEYERAQIAERTRRGKVYRARSGSPAVLSGTPYGYRYVRKSDEAEAQYNIFEPEAMVVRQIFRRYVEDQVSLGALARWLSEEGTPTARGKSRWDRSTLWGMLRNPAYCGRAAFGKTQRVGDRPRMTRSVRLRGGKLSRRPATRERPREEWIEIPVPALVSEQQFELAGRRLQANKRFASRRTKEPTLLQGLVACQSCGYSYYRTSTRTSSRKLYYYRCLGSDDYRHEGGRVCQNRPVRQDYLDELVWSHVTTLLTDPGLIRVEIDRRLQELQSTHPAAAQRSRLELQLSRLTTAKNRLLEAYQEQLLSLDELRGRMPELRRREASVRMQVEALETQMIDRAAYLKLVENLEGFLARLSYSSEKASIQDRQRVVRLLIKEILVGPERIVVRHSIPTSTPRAGPSYPLRGRSQLAALGQCAPRRSG